MVALGTTVLRTLEAAAIGPRTVAAGPGATDCYTLVADPVALRETTFPYLALR